MTQTQDLDSRLKDIAINNWDSFSNLIGQEAILAAKVCLLRSEGKSYSQISIKLSITESQARYAWYKFNDK